MLDNPLNHTQDPINSNQADTLGSANGVVTETQKPWSLSTLERSLLFVVGFATYFLAFLSGRAFVEWQFGLTIVLAAVATVVLPVLYRENKRVTSQLNDERFCTCFCCSITYLLLFGVGLFPMLVVWIGGKTTYELIAGLGSILIVSVLVLYMENERVSSQLSEEVPKPRTFRHALIFVALAIIVGGVGWLVGTATRTFVEIAMPT